MEAAEKVGVKGILISNEGDSFKRVCSDFASAVELIINK